MIAKSLKRKANADGAPYAGSLEYSTLRSLYGFFKRRICISAMGLLN